MPQPNRRFKKQLERRRAWTHVLIPATSARFVAALIASRRNIVPLYKVPTQDRLHLRNSPNSQFEFGFCSWMNCVSQGEITASQPAIQNLTELTHNYRNMHYYSSESGWHNFANDFKIKEFDIQCFPGSGRMGIKMSWRLEIKKKSIRGDLLQSFLKCTTPFLIINIHWILFLF